MKGHSQESMNRPIKGPSVRPVTVVPKPAPPSKAAKAPVAPVPGIGVEPTKGGMPNRLASAPVAAPAAAKAQGSLLEQLFGSGEGGGMGQLADDIMGAPSAFRDYRKATSATREGLRDARKAGKGVTEARKAFRSAAEAAREPAWGGLKRAGNYFTAAEHEGRGLMRAVSAGSRMGAATLGLGIAAGVVGAATDFVFD